MNALRSVRAAFVFLTRLPVGGFPYSADEFRWAPAHFPLVGLAVGALGAAVLVVFAPVGATVASAISVVVVLWATGALHEDGLADTADALGGDHGRAKMFEILKDSRVGTYGASALIVSLLLRVACLAELLELLGTGFSSGAPNGADLATFGASAPGILMVTHCLSRAGPVCLMVSLPYVSGAAARSSSVTNGISRHQVGAAVTWAVVVLGGAVSVGFSIALAVLATVITLVVTAALGLWFQRRAGGYTGDFLGATQQFLECSLLLGALCLTVDTAPVLR